jgi:hypothetical protein
MQEASTGASAEYRTLPPQFAPGVLDTLTSWILQRFGDP